MTTPPRRLRADAGRNRARVLDAAVGLFADRGDEVQMAEVARAAGVGVGTVYRHFPTRQALIEAVAERRFLEILEFARTKCAEAATGREAVRYLLLQVGRVHEEGRTLSNLIESALGDTAPRGRIKNDLRDLGTGLVDQGKADGSLRSDVTFDDLYMVVGALATVARANLGDWHRFVDIVLAGLGPENDRAGSSDR
ncbi:TetR/AcrR family transcriptional regulator [Nocardia wallacei]|uniref:TetR/AcrR family transcriptional regulator n=1 Tax=Nocardia wallacei TaxID=480035 RepID=UPI0024539C88|nr:helix-turn-helix domain-containing protein [Nocardia wallacei]